MPDPTPADVAAYTQGRLAETDPRTPLLLAGALAAARAYCGWHVTSEREDTVTVDGPGALMLMLPTLRLVELTDVIEDGVELDLAKLEWSMAGMVRKVGHLSHHGYYGHHERRRAGGWTSRLRGITVTMKHGFETAPDFNAAVLSAVDRVLTGGREVIGPFQYGTETPAAAGSAFSAAEKAILDLYRLEPRA